MDEFAPHRNPSEDNASGAADDLYVDFTPHDYFIHSRGNYHWDQVLEPLMRALIARRIK